MKEHQIFAMPSFNETFGLVYIEALNQNLPILYTKSEGIYKYFEEGHFGIGVEPSNIASIKRFDLLLIIINLQDNLEDKSFLDDFNWDNIGKVYEKLYLGEYDE